MEIIKMKEALKSLLVVRIVFDHVTALSGSGFLSELLWHSAWGYTSDVMRRRSPLFHELLKSFEQPRAWYQTWFCSTSVESSTRVVAPAALLLLLCLTSTEVTPHVALFIGPCNPPGLSVKCSSGFQLLIPVPARGWGSSLGADMKEIWRHLLV